MMGMLEDRLRDQQKVDDAEYRRAVQAEDRGYEDAVLGKPDATAAEGTYARYYAGGYEQGQADCAALAEGR